MTSPYAHPEGPALALAPAAPELELDPASGCPCIGARRFIVAVLTVFTPTTCSL